MDSFLISFLFKRELVAMEYQDGRFLIAKFLIIAWAPVVEYEC